MKAGDGGVVSEGDVAAFEAHLLEGEAKGHQVGTHSQEELQQEAAKEVVLSLRQEDKGRVKGCCINNGLNAPLIMASFITILFVHLWDLAMGCEKAKGTAAVLAAALFKPVCEKAAHISGSYLLSRQNTGGPSGNGWKLY